MTKKILTQTEMRIMRNRAKEIGFDLDFKYPTFTEPQKDVIRASLANKKVDLDIIEIIAKPEISATAMEELARGSRCGLSVEETRFLFKLSSQPVKVLSLFRKILQNKVVTHKILKRIFIKEDRYCLYSSYNIGSNDWSTPIISLSNMLDIIVFFMKDERTEKLFSGYILNKDTSELQFFLSLCSCLTEYERVIFLERGLPLNAVFCYLNYNDGKKDWNELVDFVGIHSRSRYYVKAFLDNTFDKIPNETLIRFLNVDSNWLIDELFIVHELEPSFLDNFTSYKNIHRIYRSSDLPKYAGYFIDGNDEPEILAKSIVKWIGKGESVDKIAEYINAINRFKDFMLNVGLEYNMSTKDVIKMIGAFKKFDPRRYDCYINDATRLIKGGCPLNELCTKLRIKQLF